jgi:HK97 family phage prohead protease
MTIELTATADNIIRDNRVEEPDEVQDQDHPRDDLFRMVTLDRANLRADETGDGNTLVGYAAVFDSWTEINGWEGRFLESIHPHAFHSTLKAMDGRIKVLYDHGMDPSIGNKPLGRPAVIRPDQYGLWTETPLARTTYNEDLKELLSVGAIDGMSFRMTVDPKGLPERRIKSVTLYEYGPVTFPAYRATTAGVRSREAYIAYQQARQSQDVPKVEPVEPIVVWSDTSPGVGPAPISISDTSPGVGPVETQRNRIDRLVADVTRRSTDAERLYRRYNNGRGNL